MRTFEKWDELEGKNCRVIINHEIFDEHQYDCDALQVINDDHRIGVVIKWRELFLYKHNINKFIVRDNVYMVEDDMMTITIVNKM